MRRERARWLILLMQAWLHKEHQLHLETEKQSYRALKDPAGTENRKLGCDTARPLLVSPES